MISMRRPDTDPPISSAAILAAITEPGPLPSAYWPLMSVMMPTRSTTTSAKAFAGLRVLDFSTTIAGPYCTRLLSDMGAEVIKIESAEGETMRTRPPLRQHFSTSFGQLNAGKKSLVLDLKSPDAAPIIHKLAARADILVENF